MAHARLHIEIGSGGVCCRESWRARASLGDAPTARSLSPTEASALASNVRKLASSASVALTVAGARFASATTVRSSCS